MATRRPASDCLVVYPPMNVSLCLLLGFLLCDPAVDALPQGIEGQRAGINDLVVEGAELESIPQLLLGLGTQLQQFELSYLVTQRLRRPGNVAIDFGLNIGLADGRVLTEVIDHFIAAPV